MNNTSSPSGHIALQRLALRDKRCSTGSLRLMEKEVKAGGHVHRLLSYENLRVKTAKSLSKDLFFVVINYAFYHLKGQQKG